MKWSFIYFASFAGVREFELPPRECSTERPVVPERRRQNPIRIWRLSLCALPREFTDTAAELIDLLALERLEDNLFRGQSRDIGTKYVFGGQVLGQALMAASRTVDAARRAGLRPVAILDSAAEPWGRGARARSR